METTTSTSVSDSAQASESTAGFTPAPESTPVLATVSVSGDSRASESASSGNAFPLNPLVSGFIQQILGENIDRLNRDFSTSNPVVILFADMAGFSTLGADFANSFERGAEELRAVMNVLFDAVVDDIASYGGATLYYAGDAVFAVWRLSQSSDCVGDENNKNINDDQSTQHALLQSVKAGLAIQNTCKKLSASGVLLSDDKPLSMRVAVDHGELSLIHTIDDSQPDQSRHVIVDGPIMRRLKALGEKASHEGVFIPEQVQKLIASNCDNHPCTDGYIVTQAENSAQLYSDTTPASSASPHTQPDRPSVDLPIAGKLDLTPYVSTETRSQLATLQSDWLSEYRKTQVLFANFEPQPLPADKRDSEQQQYLDESKIKLIVRIASSTVRSTGGQVVQLINDDKGLILVAAWGLALNSHENNAERAIATAIRIVDQCSDINIIANTGITSGKVFAGLLGNNHRLSFTLIGDAVNRAAAIMQRSGGIPLCDAETRQEASKRYSFTRHSEIQLKGQSVSAPLYKPGTESLRDQDHSGDMVGRLPERQIIDQLLANTDSNVRVLHIEGVAGLGKSRLASFFIEQLEQHAIGYVKITADSMRRTIGFSAFKPIVLQLLLDKLQASEPEQLTAGLKNLVADEYHSWIPLLNPVLPITVPENETTQALSGGGRAENTRTIMVSLLHHLLPANLPHLIVEDAHWCDSASWQLIEAVERAFPELTIAVVSRPLDLMQMPTEVRRLFTDAKKITLGPLTLNDTDQLIRNELGLTAVTDDVTQLVFKQAEGHPLYTKAFSRSLVSRDMLKTEAGYGHLKLGDVALQNVEFPDGLAGVFAEQLAAMSPEAQLTLKVASIQGRLFDLQALSVVHPDHRNPDEIKKHIDSGIEFGLIDNTAVNTNSAANAESAERTGNYRFHHALIVDTIYKLLVSDQRRSLHEATANNLLENTAQTGDNQTANAVLLAYHFEQAGNDPKALQYLQIAATNARNSYSNFETVDFLTRAMNISSRKGLHGAPMEGRKAVRDPAVRNPAVQDPAVRSPANGALVDEHQLGVWKFQTAEALRALGLYQRAEEFLIDCAESTDRKPPSTNMGAAGRLLGEFARYKLKPHRQPIAEPKRSQLLTAASANATLSEIHYELNKVPFALAEILRGANLARAAGGDSNTISKLYIGMALISTSLPWALDGDELQRDALAIAERVADDPMSSYVYMVSGVYDTGKGRWQSAHDQLKQSIAIGERCGERKNLETSMSCLGNLERLHGNFHEARQWSKLTLDLSQDRGIAHQIIWSHNGMARDMLCLNQFDELEQTIAELGELLNDPSKKRDANDNNHLVYLYSCSISALVTRDFQSARDFLDQIIAIVANIPRPQVYMIQNVGYYCDIVWNLWAHNCDRKGLLEHMPTILKSGAKVSRQYHTGKPLHELALGDSAYFNGDTDKAVSWWQASVESARDRDMPFNEAQAAHRIYQLIEAGQVDKQHTRPWQPALKAINIDRPRYWQV